MEGLGLRFVNSGSQIQHSFKVQGWRFGFVLKAYIRCKVACK